MAYPEPMGRSVGGRLHLPQMCAVCRLTKDMRTYALVASRGCDISRTDVREPETLEQLHCLHEHVPPHAPVEKDEGKLLPADCPTLNSQGVLSHPALNFASAIRSNVVYLRWALELKFGPMISSQVHAVRECDFDCFACRGRRPSNKVRIKMPELIFNFVD